VTVLIERHQQLEVIRRVLAEVRKNRRGRLLLIAGEAGAGKTSLLRAALADLPPQSDVLLGGCDSLRTARPFGPVRDWADQDRTDRDSVTLIDVLRTGTPPHAVFDAVVQRLSTRPCIAVIEDAHWADDATLDLLSFLGRRVEQMNALLVVTYRNDETAPGSALSLVLGDLATSGPARLTVPALTVEGVTQLVGGRRLDVQELHDHTGGNAFFLTECLAAESALPATVRDAVLARVQRLQPADRATVRTLSVSPGTIALQFAQAMLIDEHSLDRCVAAGVLVLDGTSIRFRHELAREAVQASLPAAERRALHRQALGVLESATDRGQIRSEHLARATHHAVAAADVQAVLRLAPRAASAAQAAGARRESVAHCELALQHGDQLEPEVKRELLIRLADQCEVLGRHADSVVAYREAIAVTADDSARASLLLRLWNPLSFAGHLDDADQALTEAVRLLEAGTAGPELGLAYAQRSSHLMLSRRLADAEPWGQAAMAEAAKHGDDETLAYAMIQSGIARWMSGAEDGLARIRDGIALAEAQGLHRLVGLGLSQIGSGGGEIRRYPEAVAALQACVSYAAQHELGSRGLYSSAWLGRCQLELGLWEPAAKTLADVLRFPRAEGVTVLTATAALGRLRARRGDPDPWSLLDRALELARHTGHLQRLWPVVAARAEAAWLEGRLADEVDNVMQVYQLAAGLEQPWASAELALWVVRAGGSVPTKQPGSSTGATPYDRLLSGQHLAAAQAWAALGCRYEEADALAASPHDAEQLTAWRLFSELGARPALRQLADLRRDLGRPVPRGPNAATLGNPAGLTDRELEVLRLVATGATNAEIAADLHLSVKTVGHHVSHVLAKLQARSRAEAVTSAISAGVDLGSGAKAPDSPSLPAP
jgi:DNA-binding CsgD family transcriptional regulator/tetratricopeptide (TPR) repeat protein